MWAFNLGYQLVKMGTREHKGPHGGELEGAYLEPLGNYDRGVIVDRGVSFGGLRPPPPPRGGDPGNLRGIWGVLPTI